MTFPVFQPLPLSRRPEPFSDPDWVFEVKYDGFRALAYVERGNARLVSRKANAFASFADLTSEITKAIGSTRAVLDGEIVCLDESGYSQFNELLFRRGSPRFCSFDLLWIDGNDLRDVPLIERKRALRRLVPKYSDHLLYVDHLESEGERLFELACKHDLEGIVAKHRHSRYTAESSNPAWIKIKNRNYSQTIGRDELFERRYEENGAPAIGWIVCDRACAAAQS